MAGDRVRWEVPAAFDGWKAFQGVLEVRPGELTRRPKRPADADVLLVVRSGDPITLIRGRLLPPWMRLHVVLAHESVRGWANVSFIGREFRTSLRRFGLGPPTEIATWVSNGASRL